MNEFGREVVVRDGEIEIRVAPEMGFSLVGFRWRGREILDARSEADFLAVRKGLGPLILPHFNQLAPVPEIDRDTFPHVRQLEVRGVRHPFQHGVGRYVAWEATRDGPSVRGRIAGDTPWSGYRLAQLTGYDFSAAVTYSLRSGGLDVSFDLRGEQPVAAGIHFYYDLVDRTRASVRLPGCAAEGALRLDLAQPADRVFPMADQPRRTEAVCTLETPELRLATLFPTGGDPEGSFDSVVVFSPPGASFACIEPLSCLPGEPNAKKRFRGTIRLEPGPPAGPA